MLDAAERQVPAEDRRRLDKHGPRPEAPGREAAEGRKMRTDLHDVEIIA